MAHAHARALLLLAQVYIYDVQYKLNPKQIIVNAVTFETICRLSGALQFKVE